MMKRRDKPLPPITTTSTILKQLAPFIEKSGLTLLRLSNRAGLSRYTIYRWFRGEGRPSAVELEAIADLVDAEIIVVSKRTASIVRKYAKELQ
jgi:transcriptional regulator with XRE-family HTH domain